MNERVSAARYDRIGRTYTTTRRADPRVAARLHAALMGACRIVNVGAGTGSYEPSGRVAAALDPSAVMLAQRDRSGAPAVRGTAEHLPFRDGAFDAALVSLTIHHWGDWRQGIAEIRRVASRAVVLTWDPELDRRFWLTDEYLPEAAAAGAPPPALSELVAALGGARVEVVPVPADCADGFYAAWWARPEAYLDPVVRDGISCCALLDDGLVAERTARLAADLASGAWDARHGHLRSRADVDLGYRLVVAG